MSMTLMLDLFLILGVCELLVVSRLLRPIRRPLAAGIAISLALLSGGLVGTRFSVAMVLLGLLSLYRVVNLLRVVQDRINEIQLRRSVRLTTISLLVVQLGLLGSIEVADRLQPVSDNWWLALSINLFVLTVLLTLSTRRNLAKTLPPDVSKHFSDNHLPALSVCIPARNETSALETCLTSLVASDYPKLEIIVLDDCSQGSRTSDIIRGFAHDGVRFIKGDVPPDDWLAKNWAYQRLFDASSGELVLFCGVDARFESGTLRSLVTAQLAKQKRMLSVVPRNAPPSAGKGQLSFLLQPMRYAWELCLPRRLFNRPPVLSTCWIAERKLIAHSGAFAAVRKMITPEAYFAKRAVLKDGYGFVRSTVGLPIMSDKDWLEQWETAIRTRYPQLRRRIDLVFIVSLIELALGVAPVVLLLFGLVHGLWLQAAFAAAALVFSGWCYGRITRLTYGTAFMKGLLLTPVAVLLDAYIRHQSMWRYEFGEVNWKGRNVCLPVMRVIPHLPKLS